jgi:signal transduction histidine kinase
LNIPLKFLFPFLTFFACASLMVTHLVWEYVVYRQMAGGTQSEQLLAIGHLISKDIETNLLTGNHQAVDVQIQNALLLRELRSVKLIDEANKILHASDRLSEGDKIDSYFDSTILQTLSEVRDKYSAAVNVSYKKGRIHAFIPIALTSTLGQITSHTRGVLVIEMSINQALQRGLEHFWTSVIVTLVTALACASLVSYYFQRTFMTDFRKILVITKNDAAIEYKDYGHDLRTPELIQLRNALIGMLQDIEQGTIRIAQSELRLRRFFSLSRDGLLMASGRGPMANYKVLESNQVYQTLVHESAAMNDQTVALEKALPAPVKEMINLTQLMEGNQEFISSDIELDTAGGTRRYRATASLDYSLSDENTLYVRLMDIETDYKRESEYREAAKLHKFNAQEMEKISRLRDEFLASMSHELRTPLNGILGACEILTEPFFGSLTEKQIEMVTIAENCARHLLQIVNTILDIAKIDSGKMELNLNLYGLNELLTNARSLSGVAASKAGVQLKVEMPSDSHLLVLVDKTSFRQILLNLLSNAIKYSRAETVVTLQCERLPSRGAIRFDVIDQGPGLEPEVIRELFNPFEQLSTGLNRSHEGTGLGLTLVRKLTQMNLGHIEICSGVGRGSRFSVVVPDHTQLDAISTVSLGEKKGAQLAHPLREACRVVIVDSSEPRREALQSKLKNMGIKTTAYASVAGLLSRKGWLDEIILAVEYEKTLDTLVKVYGKNLKDALRVSTILAITDIVVLNSDGHEVLPKAPIIVDGTLTQPFHQETLDRLLHIKA